MNWLKKNPAQLSLAIAALVMLAVAFLLYSNANDFSTQFEAGYRTPSEDNKIPPTDIQIVADRIASLEKPATWTSKAGSLFVSKKFLIKNGKITSPGADGEPLHPPLPNKYIIDNGFDITAGTVLSDDPDADGFNNQFEYAGLDGIQTTWWPQIETDSTDPNKADSHPPYHTRLYLVRIHKVKFRLLFRAYDYDAKTKKCTIQVNPIDRGGKTVFVELGSEIGDTKWKFDTFDFKDGGDKDESTANMVNVVNGQKLALKLNVEGNSPESYAVFAYKWVAVGGTATQDFAKRKDETFTLDPEPAKTYKVLSIEDTKVEVQLPSGEKKVFPLTPNPPPFPPTPNAPK